MRVPLTVGHCSAWQAGRASSPLICAWGGQAARPGLRYRGVDDVKWHSVSSHKTTARRRPALLGAMHNSTTMQYPPSPRWNISTSSHSPNNLQPPSDTSLRAAVQVQTHTHAYAHAQLIRLPWWLMNYMNWECLVRHWSRVLGISAGHFVPVSQLYNTIFFHLCIWQFRTKILDAKML